MAALALLANVRGHSPTNSFGLCLLFQREGKGAQTFPKVGLDGSKMYKVHDPLFSKTEKKRLFNSQGWSKALDKVKLFPSFTGAKNILFFSPTQWCLSEALRRAGIAFWLGSPLAAIMLTLQIPNLLQRV